jgi:hypothetical protein
MHDVRPKDKGTALVSCLLSTFTAAAFSADVSTILGEKKGKHVHTCDATAFSLITEDSDFLAS